MATLDQIRQKFPSARDLSDNEIIARLSDNTGVPYEQVAQRFGFTKDTSSGFFGGAQDVVIEAANAAAGLVGSVGEFISPGNRVSRAIQENIIEPGEARQTVPTQLAKRALSRGLESSELGPQARAVYDYVTENPLLAAGQALGSFAPIGLPVRGAQVAARGLGLGTQGAARAGLGTGAVVSGAAGGGDAAGSAYDLVMRTPREVLLAHPQAQELINAGVTDEAAIYEELATRAARRASVVPAVVGAVAGTVGAERLLTGPARGLRSATMQVGGEALTEGLEEGVTTYSGRAAAQTYNPDIDPMAGVFGSALLGSAMGAGTAAPLALARLDRGASPAPAEETDLTQERKPATTTAPATAPTDYMGPPPPLVGPVVGRDLAGFDPYAAIEARAAAGQPMSQREQEQLLSSFFAAQQAGEQYTDLLAGRQRGLEAAQAVGQQYQRMIGQRGDQLLQAQDVGLQARPIVTGLQTAADTEAARVAAAQQAGAGAQALPGMVAGAGTAADFRRIMDPNVMQPIEPAPVAPAARTSLLPTQAPFSNIRMDRPGAAPMVEGPTSRLEDRPAAEAVAPVVSPPSGATAVPAPAAPAAAGVSLRRGKRGPVQVGDTVRVNDTDVVLDTDQAVAWNAAQEAYDGKVRRAKALTNYQERESQLRAAGMQLSAERRKITGALTAKEQSTATDEPQLAKLLEDVDTAETGQAPPAAVTGPETIKAPGRTSIGTEGLRRIRDALFKGKEARDEGENRIVTALNNFAAAYKVYLDQGGQAVSKREQLPKTKAPTDVAETQALKVENLAANVRATLAEVGQAVNGNAKDIEAVVRLVKDMAQGKIVAPGKTKADAIKAGRQVDTMLSQAWAAAKRETFMGEEVDMADVRTGPIRAAREQAGAVPPLVAAAAEGVANPKGKGEKFTGLAGILQYIRNSGTPFERLLAATLRDVITGQESPIKVEFIEAGTPRFDPRNNTVYLRREESPEVVLHEAFHAALQSYVYRNAKDPAVMQLKKAVKAVVNFKGPLSPKAREVQDLLKKLTAEKNDLDAVLELVSYGNTFYEFRRAMQDMPSQGVPASFRQSVLSVWQYIKTLARKLLGGKDSLASDVLESSMDLLERARAKTPEAGVGNVLEAAVTSETQALEGAAKEAGYADAAQFAKGPGAFKTPTQLAFEAVGLGRVNGKDLRLTRSIKEAGAETAEWIRKNAPTVERMILNFNSRFSNGPLMNQLIEAFKFDQNTGYLQMEKVAQHLAAHPDQAKAFLSFMDGDSKALDGVKNSEGLKAIATNLRNLMDRYIQSLPANSAERRAFERVPFSQYLLHPKSVGQVAGTKFGVKTLAGILGTKTRGETSIDTFKQFLATDANGDVVLDDPLYQLFEDKLGQTLPAGFISKAKYEAMGNAPAGYKVDTTQVWKFSQYKEGEFKFTSSMTAKQAAEALKTEELSAALLNTTAALAHTYASQNFLSGLLSIGRVDGKPTAQSVAFDNVDDVNRVFGTGEGARKISEDKVLKVSDEASRSPQVRWQTQRTGTWVQLPDSDNYGPLAGKIVPGPVWNSMLDMHDRSPLLNSRAFNNTMTFFKKSKTVYNPGTHVTNILSNVTLATMHGISFRTLGQAAKMFVQFETNPNAMKPEERALVQAFYDSGAVLGQFASSEVKQTVYDKLSQAITPDSDSSYLTKLKTFANYEKNKARIARYDNIVTDVYAAEDNVFRFAAFLNTAGNIQLRDGTRTLTKPQMEEAGLAARKMFLDYDIDARAIRALRQSFMPFVSWSYAIMPVLGRMAIEKPWAIANVLMAYALMSAAMEGDDEEEVRKAAPEYLRDRAWGGLGPYMHLRIPFVGDAENPVYFNLGKYIPMFTLFQPPPGEAKLAGQEWVPGFATPSGPIVTLISALNGYDPFTGKPMHDPTDTQWDKLVQTGKAVYDTMAPAAVNSKFWSNISDLSQGVTGPTGVEKSAMFLARNLGGLGLYQFNVDESRFYQDNEVKKIEREFSTAMNKAKRREMSKGYPDYEALDEELDVLAKRLEKRIAEIRGEKPPEE